MQILSDLKDLTPNQRNAVLASFLGWTLDAFDFFIIVFVLKDIAKEFKADIPSVTATLFLTLAMRPVGRISLRHGGGQIRATADANDRHYVLLGRRIYLRIRTVVDCSRDPPRFVWHRHGWRMGRRRVADHGNDPGKNPRDSLRFAAGRLSERLLVGGRSLRHLLPFSRLARNVYGGRLPAFLVLFIRRNVEESPAWQQRKAQPSRMGATIKGRWKLFIYVIILMTAFNSFSHGTQDIYPTFLQVQQKYPPQVVSTIAVIYNLGAILGGLVFGAFSEHIGRRRAIVTAALLTLPVIPLWAFSNNVVLLSIGAFLIQFFVQGAWGVIPVHLNELSPDSVRGTFPGFTYQLGNFFASKNGTIQTTLAVSYGNNYGLALAITAGIVAIAVAAVTAFGPEAQGVEFGEGSPIS